MPDQVSSTVARSERVQELLLGYLRAVLNWPGADGIALEEVLLSYPALAERGCVPDRQELLLRHPGLSAELEAFFAFAAGRERR